jgi:hypothetical protein
MTPSPHAMRAREAIQDLPNWRDRDVEERIQNAIDASKEPVTEMALCEPSRVMLRPGQLYRFHAHENCADCQRLAAPYIS